MKPHQISPARRTVAALSTLALAAVLAACASSAGIQSQSTVLEPQAASTAARARVLRAATVRRAGDI